MTPLISQMLQLFARNTSAIRCKGNIFKFGVDQKWDKKMRVFQPISRRTSEKARDKDKVAINH